MGTFVSEELKRAVKSGYSVLKIYEVPQFDETTQYDNKTCKGGLFSEYINTFITLKTESSGPHGSPITMTRLHTWPVFGRGKV